jgi:hypothetical protein
MGLLARKLETPPAAPVPTRRRNSVTRGQLATNGHANGDAAEPVQYLTVAQAKALVDELHDLIAWVLGAMGEEFALSNPSQSHLFDLLGRSARGSPAREKLLRKIAAFKAADVPRRTQAEWLRYQATGKW